jgi:hypothetical protein
MVPKSVMIFALTVRPANTGRIYLYLYSNSLAHSWKIGVAKKYTSLISYRHISKKMEIAYGIVEDSIHQLIKINAIKKVEQNNKGTVYKVNVPEWYDEEKGEWHFEDPEKSRTFYAIDEDIDTLKHIKTRLKEDKIPLFKKIF